MADKIRKGMVIKNTAPDSVTLKMQTRQLTVRSGEAAFITAEEVRDPVFRQNLQVRSISIVRPATMEETNAEKMIEPAE